MKTDGAAAAGAALGACEAFCAGSQACNACSVDCSLGSTTRCQWVALPQCGAVSKWPGLISGDISRKAQGGKATMTLKGPADAWFAVGLDAVQMSDQPYTIVANASGFFEQKLGTCGSEADHCPGTLLETSASLVSNTVDGKTNTRTVVLTRDLAGKTSDHYSFDLAKDTTLKFISAVGAGQTFAYHKNRALGVLTLADASSKQPTCICDTGANGQLCEDGGTACRSFTKNCVPSPAGDLLSQRNPTCNSRQYAGGLQCCSHKRMMLDEAQANASYALPTLRYHMKFRFWFQEYVPANTTVTLPVAEGASSMSLALVSRTTTQPSHHDLPRIYYQTEAWAGEYDIPPAFWVEGKHPKIPGYPAQAPYPALSPGTTCTGSCPDGDDCECVHEIVFKWTVSNIRLIYAGGHCHAPACISMELYRNDTGHEMELLCRQLPVYGKGTPRTKDNRYDEAGYLTLPPCLWGDDKGLHPSVLLPANTPMVSIKKNRNQDTGHFGEMASWQMRGVNF